MKFFILYIYIMLPLYSKILLVHDEKLITKFKLDHTTLSKNKSGNVLQGIARIDNIWVVTQSLYKKHLLINILDEDGKSLFNKEIAYASHGQDVSLLKDKDGRIFLYTVGKHWDGISKFELVKDNKTNMVSDIVLIGTYKLNIGKNTPTVTNDGKYIITVAHKMVFVYDREEVEHYSGTKAIYSFILDKKQRQKGQWVQGVNSFNNYICVLTGNNKPSGKKWLIVYDAYGKTIKDISLTAGKEFVQIDNGKWELEGLAYYDNGLYTTVMTGKNGANIQRLYKVLEVK